MEKIRTFLKAVDWKKQFTTWTGFVGRAWNYIWGVYMVCLAGISFYLSFVEHPAYASVGIWQLFAVLMWAMFHGVINMQKDSRKLWKQLDDLKDDHIKDLYKMIEARDQEIINLKTGN